MSIFFCEKTMIKYANDCFIYKWSPYFSHPSVKHKKDAKGQREVKFWWLRSTARHHISKTTSNSSCVVLKGGWQGWLQAFKKSSLPLLPHPTVASPMPSYFPSSGKQRESRRILRRPCTTAFRPVRPPFLCGDTKWQCMKMSALLLVPPFPHPFTVSLPWEKVAIFEGATQIFLFQEAFGPWCTVTYPNAANYLFFTTKRKIWLIG